MGSRMICAMRGRNPENPSDRTAGAPTEQRLEVNGQGICNCLTSVQKDNLVFEVLVDLYNRKVRDDGLCGTITANGNTSSTHCGTFGILQLPRGKNRGGLHDVCPAVTENCFQENNFLCERSSLRKLTPRECFRLMGFSDEDFDRAAAVNSNTQLYKQAGNSIVKNVLVAVIGQMFEGREDVYKTLQ